MFAMFYKKIKLPEILGIEFVICCHPSYEIVIILGEKGRHFQILLCRIVFEVVWPSFRIQSICSFKIKDVGVVVQDTLNKCFGKKKKKLFDFTSWIKVIAHPGGSIVHSINGENPIGWIQTLVSCHTGSEESDI